MTQEKLISRLLEAPETVIENLDLIYVDDTKMPIRRLRRGRGFIYKSKNRQVKNKKQLTRIKDLVIPPAWEEVKITDLPNGHLQAVGNDDQHRKQYLYHPVWTKIRNQTKFYKMSSFGQKLAEIRTTVEQDLKQKGWPKTKVLALVVKLMEETHIRIGGEHYAKRNQSYGLSTLRKKHVDIHNNKIKFEFVGKKGKEHSVTLSNKKLVRLVCQCEEIPGWELFKYYDTDGEKQTIDSTLVNEYLHTISGEFFTAKDFRTWSASAVFFDTLIALGTTEDEKEIQKNLITAFDAAAKALGNTRSVCKKYYVHPLLVTSYQDGSISKFFKMANSPYHKKDNLTPSETAMLTLFKTYKPDFSS